MPHLISDDRGLALLVGHGIPAHDQFAIILFYHHIRGHSASQFVDVGDGDGHNKTGPATLIVADDHDDGVAVLLLKVISPLCLDLSCARVNGKTVCVGTAEAIGEGIAIGIGCNDGIAYGLTRWGILSYSARHGRL